MSSHLWTPIDNHLASNSYHQFCQTVNVDSHSTVFAFLAEALPEMKINQASRSNTGALLALKSAKTAFDDICMRGLDFNDHFWPLFSKHWQAKVYLHAIQDLREKALPETIAQLRNTESINNEQKIVLKKYDTSIGFCFIDKNMTTFFQTGAIKVALLNSRYNCEIKIPEFPSLTDLMFNDQRPAFEKINIKKYRLVMPVLLSNQYTSNKTEARLKANIFKIYRSIDTDNSVDDSPLPSSANLVAIKSNQILLDEQAEEQIEQQVVPPSTKPMKKRSKLLKAGVSLAGLLTVTTITYYLWPVQTIEAGPKQFSISKEEPLTPTPTATLITNKAAANKDIEKLETQKALANKEKERLEKLREAEALELQKEKQRLASLEIEKRKALIEQQAKEAEAKAKLLEIQEAEKQRLLEEQAALAEQQRIEEKAEAEALAKKQKEAAEKLAIAKDLELISQHEEKVRQQEREAEQNRIAEKQRKDEQIRLAAAKKYEQKKRQEEAALIQKRRIEFERQKAAKQTTQSSSPVGRSEKQRQTQQYIQRKTEEKRKAMAAELRKQQANNEKTKDARQQVIQKTLTHQLVNYSKTFSRHTKQLNQKIDSLQRLSKQADTSNTNYQRKRELLESKKTDINLRIDALTKRYANKLRKICTSDKIYPVFISPRANPTERVALTAISQQLKQCSKTKTISTKTIKRTLLNKFSRLH